MAITPSTDLRIIKSPLTLSNKHQITFDDIEKQEEYFLSLPFIEIEDISYQRKDGIVRFDGHIDSILEYNYCMYKNTNYCDKWFYAFIVGMEYINDHRTDIKIVTDVFQTWQFDLHFMESFVEREMVSVSEDIAGANLFPESFEIGEPIINATSSIDDLDPVYIIAFTGDTLDGRTLNQNATNINGVPSSVAFLLTDKNSINYTMNIINTEGQGDKILTAFAIPKLAVKSILPPPDPPGTTTFWWLQIPNNTMEAIKEITLNSRPSTIDSYTPRNKKLLQYPYLYLGFNPQNGTEKIYRYENFLNATPKFKIMSEVNPNPTIEVIPEYYRGDGETSINDSAIISGYPTISYKNDVYNSWLAKNSEIINLQMERGQFNFEVGAYQKGGQMIMDMLGIALNPAEGGKGFANIINNATDLLVSGKNYEYDIKQTLAQIEAQKLMPDQASLSSNTTLLGYGLINENVFTRYSIKREFAEKIDKYFDMFGYSINTVKIPELNNRAYWNYVKTVDINILADIPQSDLLAIKNIFNNGVTLWHDTDYFLDYSQNNRE